MDTFNDALDAMRYAIFGYLIIIAKRTVEDIFEIKEYYTQKVNPARRVKEYRERDYTEQVATVSTYKPAYQPSKMTTDRQGSIKDLRSR